MNYEQLLTAAGYKGKRADYLARKMQARGVTAKQLTQLPAVFGAAHVAGIDLYELSAKLVTASVDATPAAVELAQEADVELTTVKGSGKGGRVTKRDVESAAENEE